MQPLNDTILLSVHDDPGVIVSVSPAQLATTVNALERLFEKVAMIDRARLTVELGIVDVRPGSVEFHFHTHYHLAPEITATVQPRSSVADFTTIGANLFAVISALLLASSIPGVGPPRGEPRPKESLAIPDQLKRDKAVESLISNFVTTAAKLGPRVILRVPDAPAVEISASFLPGSIASKPQNPLPPTTSAPPTYIGRLRIGPEHIDAKLDGQHAEAFLGELTLSGSTHRVVVVRTSKRLPLDLGSEGTEVRVRALPSPDLIPFQEVPPDFRCADGIVQVVRII